MALPTYTQAANLEIPEKHICLTSEEIVGHILERIGAREPEFTVSVCTDLPEADMDGNALLRDVLDQDSGFIRWGCKNARSKKIIEEGCVTFRIQAVYWSTAEEDAAARTIAAAIAGRWKESGLSSRQQVESLIDYIAANWRYDDTYTNMAAYSTFTDHTGVCLGMVMGCQLILDELGIPSKAVNGKVISAKMLHIVLLVKIDGFWYSFDPVAYAGRKPAPGTRLNDHFADYFTPDPKFVTEAFRKAYPMNESDLIDSAA